MAGGLLRFFNRQVRLLKVLTFLLACYPAAQLYYQYRYDQLGTNGLETLQHTTGFVALILYIMTLAITPLRRMLSHGMILIRQTYGKRLGDWNWMVKLRRMLGVFSFMYATLHLLIYLYFELDFEWEELGYAIEEKQFIVAGISAWVLLLPLFLTSTDYSMRLLRKNWRRLHRLMYPIGVLVAIHYLALTKPGVYEAWPYAIVIGGLLLFRLLAHWKIIFKRRDDGMLADR